MKSYESIEMNMHDDSIRYDFRSGSVDGPRGNRVSSYATEDLHSRRGSADSSADTMGDIQQTAPRTVQRAKLSKDTNNANTSGGCCVIQ
jgi:hypothetical protein